MSFKKKPFRCKLWHNQRYAILKTPNRKKEPQVPSGETLCRFMAPDGTSEIWVLVFRKIAVNTGWLFADKPGTNGLKHFLVRHYGPEAGKPGRADYLIFEHVSGNRWTFRKET